MKNIVAILSLVGLAVAADTSQLPKCAQSCVTKFTTGSNIGDCAQLDAKCICSDKDFLSDISCCIADVCSADEQAATIAFAVSFCRTQGVTDLPTTVTCASTASNTWGTSSATGTTNAITTTDATAAQTSESGTSAATSASANVGSNGDSGAGAGGIFGGLIAAAVLL
ncbi:hypothetical protein F4779DRAFT_322384 [Xylariaceae sp. FL0662B]|nr:hypothetical protein F4779DRAFT_322384 [Xylariaceae sp. FL0662B]